MALYGETKSYVIVRSEGHLILSALTGKRVNKIKKFGNQRSLLLFNHVDLFEDFLLLTFESNPFKTLIKEF